MFNFDFVNCATDDDLADKIMLDLKEFEVLCQLHSENHTETSGIKREEVEQGENDLTADERDL